MARRPVCIPAGDRGNETIGRRSFLKGAVAAPLVVQASVLGRGAHAAPNDRVTIGCIGVGGRGSSNLRAFMHEKRAQVAAVCDVDRNHRQNAQELAGLADRDAYNDYRELLARDDIDAVSIGTPDHWHALNVVDAANAGKDLFCEKPLSLTMSEGRHMVEAVERNERVLQTGTWRRSREGCRKACELVLNGRIGRVHTVRVYVPEGFNIRGGDFEGPQPVMDVPEGFDYDRWLGPAPYAPYTEGRCHFNFRWILDYSAGYITDWGAHYYDVAQWGLGTDRTGPKFISGEAAFPDTSWLYNASLTHRIEYEYADGRKLVSETTTDGSKYGIHFEGDEGWIWVENEEIKASKESIVNSPLESDAIRLYNSANHYENFVDCVLNRKEPAAPVEIGHRSAAICHLGHIATILKRPLKWNPESERFEGDEEANGMLSRPSREPYSM